MAVQAGLCRTWSETPKTCFLMARPIFQEEVLGLDSSDSDDDEIRQLKSQLRRVQELRKKSTLDSDLEENAEEEEEDSDTGR